jgi:hypothetical protein
MADVDDSQGSQGKVKDRFWVKYPDPSKATEVEVYARRLEMDVPTFLKFAARRYMDQYRKEGSQNRKGVPLDGPEGKKEA